MKNVYMLCALLAVLLTACTTTTTNDVRVNPEPIPFQPLHPMAGVPSLQEQAGQRTAADSAYLQADAVPELNRESYNALTENRFLTVANSPLSTFSIDVDTASYANVRRFINTGSLPPTGAVRLEEMLNYFPYTYPKPQGKAPLALSAELGPSPFHKGYQLMRLGLNSRDIPKEQLAPSNLVFLIDVSGSMQAPNKLPLLQQSLDLLVQQLDKNDRVAVVVYAGEDRVVLKPTLGNRHSEIMAAINNLQAGGSTHASSGLRTAYKLAHASLIKNGNNRIILASDGDFNVGITSRDELQRLIERERQAGVYLTVLGFGMGNYHDDTMEILANKGNGNYAYINNLLEAKKVLVKELTGTLFTLAKDVKIQVEFNPAMVGAYRLLGYENRLLAAEDFRDDSKDAGEIGPGHRVTALYELIPAGHKDVPDLEARRYQQSGGSRATNAAMEELLNVQLRYKEPAGHQSALISLPVRADRAQNVDVTDQMSEDFRFAAAVAGFAMLLTDSEHLGDFTWERCLQLARAGRGADPEGYRAEFYRLVEAAQLIKGSSARREH